MRDEFLSMEEHSPFPWKVEPGTILTMDGHEDRYIVSAQRDNVCNVYPPRVNAAKDAAILAAAPDMMVALDFVLSQLDDIVVADDEECRIELVRRVQKCASDALKKARG